MTSSRFRRAKCVMIERAVIQFTRVFVFLVREENSQPERLACIISSFARFSLRSAQLCQHVPKSISCCCRCNHCHQTDRANWCVVVAAERVLLCDVRVCMCRTQAAALQVRAQIEVRAMCTASVCVLMTQ
jgi:hypothetical protein